MHSHHGPVSLLLIYQLLKPAISGLALYLIHPLNHALVLLMVLLLHHLGDIRRGARMDESGRRDEVARKAWSTVSQSLGVVKMAVPVWLQMR